MQGGLRGYSLTSHLHEACLSSRAVVRVRAQRTSAMASPATKFSYRADIVSSIARPLKFAMT